MDDFYILKNEKVKDIKDILLWADEHGKLTSVTMLKANDGLRRIKSDKKFNEVLKLINSKTGLFFRIILRNKMNLFLLLYNKKVIRDMVEIFVRGIDVDSKEYFIMILMENEYLSLLQEKYVLKKI
ncbi:MAG: hypothetical protein LHV68_08605 [Elusimicrobia bacterium]|nr:hypothetical protein [Candidatus Liberimonas magnetica]